MSTRSTALVGTQVGVETTHGTGVAATTRLAATNITIQPLPEVTPYGPRGSRYDTGQAIAKEMSTLAVESAANGVGYQDLSYLFNMLIAVQTGAAPHTFLADAFAREDITSLTIESGDGVDADKCNYGFLDSLTLTFTQSEVTLSGSGFGRTESEGVVITPTPTFLDKTVLNPKSWTFLVGANVAGLAAVSRPAQVVLAISNWRKPKRYGNSDPSFTDTVELKPSITMSVTLENDSVARGFLTDLRAGTQKVARILCTNDSKTFRATMPFIWLNPNVADDDDVWSLQLDLGCQYSSALAGLEVYLDNGLTSL